MGTREYRGACRVKAASFYGPVCPDEHVMVWRLIGMGRPPAIFHFWMWLARWFGFTRGYGMPLKLITRGLCLVRAEKNFAKTFCIFDH